MQGTPIYDRFLSLRKKLPLFFVRSLNKVQTERVLIALIITLLLEIILIACLACMSNP